MTIQMHGAALRETKWHEYALRFISGGFITAATGLIAKKFGPGIGGLFLAFPAIFPASATLLQKHEQKRKQERGLNGKIRACTAVAADSAGAALGSFGLMAFAVVAWKLFTVLPAWETIFLATLAWAFIAILAWILWKHR